MRILIIACVGLALAVSPARSGGESLAPDEAGEKLVQYKKDQGLVLETKDGGTSLWLGLRFQYRYTDLDGSPVDPATLPSQKEDEFSLNRGRIKGGGHLLHPSVQLYSEYDFSEDYLLDFRTTIDLHDQLSIRAGQWKTEYNRERIDSSGKQQFADRSLANYWFTIDRQLGVEVQGRLGKETSADISYWLAYVSGEGRGGGWDDGDGLGMLHVQWNTMGGVSDFSQSDIKRQKSAQLAMGCGGVYGRSQYTRFSSGGGTQLPGYETDGQSRYQLTQFMQDSSFRANGFSWQQEVHWKEVEDRHEGSTRDLVGGYAQAGYFVHEAWDALPEPLEVAFRYAVVDPDTSVGSNLQQEYTLGSNWFFSGHRNKLTADTSYIDLDDPSDPSSEWRFRLQYELSI